MSTATAARPKARPKKKVSVKAEKEKKEKKDKQEYSRGGSAGRITNTNALVCRRAILEKAGKDMDLLDSVGLYGKATARTVLNFPVHLFKNAATCVEEIGEAMVKFVGNTYEDTCNTWSGSVLGDLMAEDPVLAEEYIQELADKDPAGLVQLGQYLRKYSGNELDPDFVKTLEKAEAYLPLLETEEGSKILKMVKSGGACDASPEAISKAVANAIVIAQKQLMTLDAKDVERVQKKVRAKEVGDVG